MGKYTGFQCIICQKQFADTDDIVVCPDCGTPYHRSCFQASGKCINTSLHAVGGSWQSVQNEHRRKLGGKTCPHCGFVNLPESETCSACQNPLEQESQQTEQPEEMIFTIPEGSQFVFQAADPCCGMSPEDDMEGERLGDVASFVRTNTLYYIPLFRRFRDSGSKISLNLPCVLFPYLYFANRKMWFMSIVSIFIWIVCGLPGMFLGMLDNLTNTAYLNELHSIYGTNTDVMQMIEKLTTFLSAHEQFFDSLETPLLVLGLVFRVLLCLFGNYLYFRFVLKSVKKIREISPTQAIRNAMLTAEGGTNSWNILGCLGLYFGVWIVIYLILTFALVGV